MSSESAEPVISARGVGKCYHIFDGNVDRIRQAITGAPLSREFWALRDVNFDIHRGESLGIVGRNGSGKSTLMQIIAGTLAPTTGEVRIRGRIAALLELGSGFNPHFSGRENAILSGAILGVTRREMERRMPEIEEFADIGDFIDEPISTYSSGMQARLAFSVSVSLDPDILILDEILAVGDAAFQQKCVGRLHGLLERGVTLLFVSHAADAVRSICRKGLLLSRGEQAFFGPAGEAVDRYFRLIREQQTARGLSKHERLIGAPVPEVGPALPAAGASPFTPAFEQIGFSADREAPSVVGEDAAVVSGRQRYGTGHARIESVRLIDDDGRAREGFQFGEAVNVEIRLRAEADFEKLETVIRVRDKSGVDIFGASSNEEGPKITGIRSGEVLRVAFRFVNTLKAGPHGVSATLNCPPRRLGEGLVTLDHIDAAAAFASLARGEKLVRGKLQVPVGVEWERVSAAPATMPATPAPEQ